MYLFHIPHSGLLLIEEFMDDYKIETPELFENMFEYADLFINELFMNQYRKFGGLVNPYSRLMFDPERFFIDSHEPMAKHGLGWFYEKCILEDKPLRTSKHREAIAKFYQSHHHDLNLMTEQVLAKYNKCTIVDCHSFSNQRYWFQDKDTPLPDICIGFDDFHVDKELVKKIQKEFKDYDVQLNIPYVGSIVPEQYYHKDDRVKSVMIEINKKIYMNSNNRTKREKEFYNIQKKLNNIFN